MNRTRLLRALVLAASLTAAATVILMLVGVAQQGRILPGTTVAGVQIGGQDAASARRILEPAISAQLRHPVVVSVPGGQLLLDPRDVGLSVDLTRAVDEAFARGRTPHIRSVAARLLATARDVEVAPRRTVDAELLAAWVDAAADRLEREATIGDITVGRSDGRFTVTVDGPRGSLAVDRAASVEALGSALASGERRARLQAAAGLPPVDRAPIERIADDVEQALQRPMMLRHEGRTLTIEPDVLARLIEIEPTVDAEGRTAPALLVPAGRVRTLLLSAGRTTFDRDPRDARILTDREPPVTHDTLGSTTFRALEAAATVEPGVSRVAFDPALTAAQVARLIEERRRSAPADLEVSDPDLSTAEALQRRPTHLLGTFTTSYAAGGARTVNIRLLADILDDRLIAPGATFSVNGTSGPRRCEDGFVPAGTIVRGELVDTCGGGVSQVGTTIMNAAFFAGIKLEEWQPHSFFISRYPAGREATLSHPELDVRFTNDTDGWLVLRASTTPQSITVTLYGVPRWQEVAAEHSERRAPTDFSTEERPTTALPPGTRRVVQAGGPGFTITVARRRTPVDDAGAEIDRPTDGAAAGATEDVVWERWTTVYRPQQRIVEVGVRPSGTDSTSAG